MRRVLILMAIALAACGSVPDIYFVGDGGTGDDGAPNDATTTDVTSDAVADSISSDSPICGCQGAYCGAGCPPICATCKSNEVCCGTTPNIMCKPATAGCH